MKKILLLVCAIVLLQSVVAEVPKEDPYISVGSDFLVLPLFSVMPAVELLFDDTTVYLDNENDGTWDYMWTGDRNDWIELNPGITALQIGALVHTDKPAILRQMFVNDYLSIPPISSIDNSYFIIEEAYIVAEKDITVYVDECADGSVDYTHIGRDIGWSNWDSTCDLVRLYSDDPFYISNGYSSVGALTGTDFYTAFSDHTYILVTEHETEIRLDFNNDDAYDQNYTKNRGIHYFEMPVGTHIITDKPVSIYSDATRHIMPTEMIGSDAWSEGFALGLYNEYSGFYKNTTLFEDDDLDLYLDNTYTVAANQEHCCLEGHFWSDMPAIFYMGSQCYSAYSVIYSTSWPLQKLMGQNQEAYFNVRTFNPFATTTITDVGLKIMIPSNFAIPGGFSLDIEKKNLMTDVVIDTATISKTPVLNGQYYEVVISNADSTIFNQLSPWEYYDITYTAITPDVYGNYELPVETTYTAPTWQK